MKKTFIHTFSNGDVCHLILDFTGERPMATATWKKPNTENRFDQIEDEYIQWRTDAFNDFMAGLSFNEGMEIVRKLNQ